MISKSDQYLFSSFNITPEWRIEVMRMKKMITKLISSWLLNKFSLSAPLEMYREQYGEYAHWCYCVKRTYNNYQVFLSLHYLNLSRKNVTGIKTELSCNEIFSRFKSPLCFPRVKISTVIKLLALKSKIILDLIK